MIALSNISIKIIFVFLGFFVASANTTLEMGWDVLWFSIDFLLLTVIFILKPRYYDKSVDRSMWALKLFLLWAAIGFVRGAIAADNYWDWKNLVRFSLTMLLPAIAFLATNPVFVKKILSFWFKYGLWLIIVFIPFVTMGDLYGAYLSPVMLLLVVFPLLPRKWKIITLIFTLLVFAGGGDSRSNLIRFFMATAIGGIYFIPFINKVFLLRTLHFSFYAVPLLLLFLALTNVFNIFRMNDYIQGDYAVEGESGKKESLTVDTRTFIYVETISSAINNDYVLQGRTPAKGYDSKVFGNFAKFTLGTGEAIRYSSEVSICNVFTWYGLIGVVLYSLAFFIGTFLAVHRSNNYFIKVIGVFVAFRWMYSFVEEFNRVDVQMATLWILIGMCYSPSIRAMTNSEFKALVRNITPRIRIL